MLNLKKKGLAEIPALIFILMVVMLLFLTLFVAGLEKKNTYSIALSSMRMQEIYAGEKSVEYGIDVAFDKAVIKAYKEMTDKWIDKSCKEENGYKELCKIDEKFYSNMEKNVTDNFLQEINKGKEANAFFEKAISPVISNMADNKYFGFEINENEINIKPLVLMSFSSKVEHRKWGGLKKDREANDYI